jgi:hypothetical protein
LCSCDINNPKNPIPLHKELTSFTAPSLRIDALGVDVIQIDHLPSLVPCKLVYSFFLIFILGIGKEIVFVYIVYTLDESSEDFTGQLFPHLLDFNNTAIWSNALNLFEKKRELYKE